jgi:tetratricopeptide (TPR) repeat protein
VSANTGGVSGASERDHAETELQRCRADLAAGDLARAAAHLGQALGHDPSLPAAYGCLGKFVEAAGSPTAARDLFKASPIPPGNAAAIIAVAAGQGELADSVELLGSVVAADPGRPWAAAPWFSPDLALKIPDMAVGRAVTTIWEAIGTPPPETVRVLMPWLELCRVAAGRPDVRPKVLCTMSALARRVGAAQDAVQWCRSAEEREKRSGAVTEHTLIMLGYAYRADGQPAPAVQAWTRASQANPANANLLLDLADTTFDQGDFTASLRWAEKAAARDKSSAKVRAALLAARFRTDGDATKLVGDMTPLIELADLSAADPDSSYIRRCLSRACEGATWLMTVPPPTEAICAAYGELARIEESDGQIVGMRSMTTSLEAPSAMSLFRSRFPQASIEIGPIVDPDPRVPVRTDFGPPLWRYDGTEATATVPPPSARALDLLHQIAVGIWADPMVAYGQAAAFGTLTADDLLGLLAHMPSPKAPSWESVGGRYPMYWQRFAQAWVCLGILHHRPEQPWPQSDRRALLLRLLFGPEDWTVEAAAFSLCVSAWRFPAQRAEVAEVVGQRYLYAAKALGRRPTQLHGPLGQVLLICPGVDPKLARQVRTALTEQREGPTAADVEKMKDSVLRKWKRRKDG